MNRKLFGITIFAVAFALVFGLGTVKAPAAASDSYNLAYGETNLFGVDEATNLAGPGPDRDVAPQSPVFDTYGINGSLRN